MTKKIMALAVTVFLLISSLCSCGATTETAKKFGLPKKIPAAKSDVVAEVDGYALLWEKETSRLILKTNDFEWNSTPDNENTALDMSVKISYIENTKSVEMETDSAALLQSGGYISAKRIENGIRLTYYFTDVKISFPVEYQLDENGFTANIITDQISEDNYKLYSISLLPFFASAKNNTDSYVLVPSGSGALMYTDDNMRALRTFDGEIYGSDENLQNTFEFTQYEAVRLPVFGVKNENAAILGIAENGAESGRVVAQCGDSSIGYSSAYVKFSVRGYANAYVKDVYGNNTEVKKFTDGIVKTKKLGVRYISVNGGYSQMAEAYRNYLYENGLKDSENEIPDVMLEFLGGARTRNLFLGIPYYSFYSTTTVKQVKTILEDIYENNSGNAVSVLKGFGEDGLDYGKLGGGFKLSGNLGTKKDLKNLISYSQEHNSTLAFDFDLIYFNKSTGGLSKSFDVAKTANSVATTKYMRSIVTGENDGATLSAKLLSRAKILNAAQKAADALEKYGFNSVSASALSSTAYSDYGSSDYYCKAKTASEVEKAINTLKGKNRSFVAQNANIYAVLNADYVMGTPSASSKENAFDMEIPFYQMVLRGVLPISSSAINLAENWNREYLFAVSTGCIPYYTVCAEYDDALITNRNNALTASCYDGIKDRISEDINKYGELLKLLSNSKIVSYEHNGNISETVFDNGIKVYVNWSEEEINTKIGIIPPYSYSYEKENS